MDDLTPEMLKDLEEQLYRQEAFVRDARERMKHQAIFEKERRAKELKTRVM